jgi:hypothetical protein
MLSANKEGISMMDIGIGFKKFREILIKVRMEPLIDKAIKRMASYKKET